MPVTYEVAIERLTAAGIQHAADSLRKWRNVDGHKGGWDGYAQAAFNSNVLRIIWPDGRL